MAIDDWPVQNDRYVLLGHVYLPLFTLALTSTSAFSNEGLFKSVDTDL